MKKIILTLALLVAFAADTWACTNGATNYPACDNNTPAPAVVPTSSSAAASTSAAGAKAGAQAGATSSQSATVTTGGATAAGGSVGNTSAAGGTASSTGTGGTSGASANGTNSLGTVDSGNSSKFNALAISLPAPSFTPPLPMTCPSAEVTQGADHIGVLFGALDLSQAKAHTDPRDCTLITLRTSMIEQCRFKSAAMLEDQLVRKYLPDFKDTAGEYEDLSPRDCDVLKHPLRVQAEAPINFFSPGAGPAVCPAPPSRALVKKRPAVAKKVAKAAAACSVKG